MKWKPVKATFKERIIGSGGKVYLLPVFKTYIFNLGNKEKKIVLLIFLAWAFSWTYTKGLK